MSDIYSCHLCYFREEYKAICRDYLKANEIALCTGNVLRFNQQGDKKVEFHCRLPETYSLVTYPDTSLVFEPEAQKVSYLRHFGTSAEVSQIFSLVGSVLGPKCPRSEVSVHPLLEWGQLFLAVHKLTQAPKFW